MSKLHSFSLRSMRLSIGFAALSVAAISSPPVFGQAASAGDTLILANGDQLTGKLVGEANGVVTFHSDLAGDLTFTWDKIKSIHTSGKFAVIEQGQHVSSKTPEKAVAQGTVAIQDEKVQVEGAAGKDIPQNNAQYMVDEDSYLKQIHGNMVGDTAGTAP